MSIDITQLLKVAHSHGASDLHISAGEPPMLRVHGEMKKLKIPELSAEETHELIYGMLKQGQRDALQTDLEIDFSMQLGEHARFRVNVFHQRRGLGAVFREIPTKILSVGELGLPPILSKIIRKERGLILVTGPTGSGKSTTLAAMVDQINEEIEGHILTIEDPIEFVHSSKRCLVNQREVGPNTNSFTAALRSALREDPDYILVGELRDLETIQLALTAAETGHLVMGTLHTSSAPKTVDRVIDVFPPEQQQQVRAMFAESIQAIVTQTLCPKIGGGRVAAIEILLGTPAVRNLIREAKVHQLPSILQMSRAIGMQSLEWHLRELVKQNLITPETAVAKSGNPDILTQSDDGLAQDAGTA